MGSNGNKMKWRTQMVFSALKFNLGQFGYEQCGQLECKGASYKS